VFTDVTVEISEIENPLVHLRNLLELRHQSLIVPQPFFPDTSYAFANAEDEESGIQKARRTWYGDRSSDRSEYNSDNNSIVWRGREDIFSTEFQRLAKLVYDPLLESTKEIPEKEELPEELPDELWQGAAGVEP